MAMLLGLFAAYCWGNGPAPLFDRDEPRYALTSLNMLDSGDWVVPRFLGEVRTAKPPATYWLQGAAMAAVGRNDFAARLPSAACATLAIATLRYGLAPAVGRRRARWAAFVTGTAGLTVAAGKLATTDGALLLCASVAWVGVVRGWWWRTWVAVGVGGLVKGPVLLGVVVVALVVGGVVRGRDPDLRGLRSGVRRVVVGTLVALGVCVPWMILVEIRAPGFLMTSIGHDVLARSVGGLEGHGRPPGFHLLLLPATFFPWSLLLPAVVVNAWRRRREPWVVFAAAGVVGPWVLFELVATKLPHYVLPTFPMLALLTADWIAAATRGRREADARRLAWPAGIAAIVAAAVVAGGGYVGVVLVEIVAWTIALLVVVSLRPRRVGLVLATLGLVAPLVAAVGYGRVAPRLPPLTVSPRAAQALADAGARSAVMVDYKEPSLAWYAALRGITAREADDVGEAAFAVTTRDALPPGWDAVAELPTLRYNDGGRRAAVVVARRPPATSDTDAAGNADRQTDRPR